MEIIKIKDNQELLEHFNGVEVAVVTALQTELTALTNLAKRHIAIIGQHRTYHKIYFEANGKEFAVAGYTSDTMGISPMAITLMELTFAFPSLRYIGLIGISAGSDSAEQNFGDILIPKNVFNYEMGKYKEDESGNIIFESDYASFPIDQDPLQKILPILNDSSILTSIQEKTNQTRSYKIVVHSGNFACGSVVIASEKKIKEIENAISRKYIGLDMETFAIVSVNQLKYYPYPKMFVIKSISDFAGRAKDDKEQDFAREISARAFIEVCSKGLINNPVNRQTLDAHFIATTTISENKLTTKTNFEQYKIDAKEFDNIDIEDVNERVKMKEKIGAKLGETILEKEISKNDISKLYSEGALVGLIFSLFLDPHIDNKEIIFRIYDRVNHPFSRHKILDTIESFLHRGYFEKKDFILIQKIFELYLTNADQQLIAKVERVKTILDKQDIIAIYSVKNKSFELNETFKIVQGQPKFSILSDEKFKEVLGIEGRIDDATDILTDTSGHVVNTINFTYVNFRDFLVYAYVNGKKDNENQMRQLWISFRNEVIIISTAQGEAEKSYPVVAKNLGNGWKEVNVNIKNCIEQLFGEEGIKYINLVKMRIRGSGKLANIVLR